MRLFVLFFVGVRSQWIKLKRFCESDVKRISETVRLSLTLLNSEK